MAKIALIATDSWYVLNFRSDTIRELVSLEHDLVVYCGNTAHFAEIAELGAVPVHVPLYGRRVSILREIVALFCLAWQLFRDRPEIALSFNPKGNLYTGLARRLFRYSWIANISGLGILGEAKGHKAGLINFVFRFALSRVSHCVFQSSTDLEDWVSAGIVPRDRTSRQYGTGVDLSSFYYIKPPVGSLTVVCAARLLEKKGIGEYIELAKFARDRVPGVEFCLAGSTVPNEEGGFPIERIREAEASGHIKFLGMVEDVRPLLAGRTLGCLLSRYKEGVPRSMIEFLATGRPILVSNFDTAIDLVPNSRTGQIFDLSDANWIPKATRFIHEISMDFALYEEMCVEARELAERRFDGGVGIKEYVERIGCLTK